jgi:alanine racemase
MHTRPVWAEISLENLGHNFDRLSWTASVAFPQVLNTAELLAVVKADAYGHNLELCGPALVREGASWLGVTSAEEGARLRVAVIALEGLPSHLIDPRILVMSGFWPGEEQLLLDHSLTPQVWEHYHFTALGRAARSRGLGPGTVPVHLEIDTGMSRQGVAPGEPLEILLAELVENDSPLLVEGVCTHFSAPEMLLEPATDAQVEQFWRACEQIEAAGLRPVWRHAGNSATVFDERQTAALAALCDRFGGFLMMRPGLALYGYPVRFRPSDPPIEPTYSQAMLRSVLSWKTRITSLRAVPAGTGAGYNSTFVAGRPTRLALVPVGYADGLNRLLSNRGSMLVRGQRAPIAGRVSMDQTILDVTDIPDVALGDEVVILGEQGTEQITAYEHADFCGTIPYEILCNIAARVPRIAVE